MEINGTELTHYQTTWIADVISSADVTSFSFEAENGKIYADVTFEGDDGPETMSYVVTSDNVRAL